MVTAAALGSKFPVNKWVLLPDILSFIYFTFSFITLMMLFALLNGYITTIVYLLVDKNIKGDKPKKVRRWVALFNQVINY